MNNHQHHGPDDLEEMLRSSLGRQADRMDSRPGGPDFAHVRGQARGIRRRRRTALGGLVVAAVVAVTVPTTLLLSHNTAQAPVSPAHSGTPSVAPSPTTAPSPSNGPSPSRTPQTTPTGKANSSGLRLADVKAGPAPAISYLHDGTAHLYDGSTTRLPGDPRTVTGFTPYHGGWLVLRDTDLTLYDNSGKVQSHGTGGALGVTGDGMRTAYQFGGTVTAGITSGMSNGEQHWTVPGGNTQGLIGFVSQGPVANSGKDVRVLRDSGGYRIIQHLAVARAASEAGDLVGGYHALSGPGNVDGAVVDAKTGSMLWHNQWVPASFSPDGKYVAATPAAGNGDADAVAILDAHTGTVVAQMHLVSNKLYLVGPVVWDENNTVLFDVTQGSGGKQSVVRLAPDGTLTRATPVVTKSGSVPAYVFATRP